MMPISLKYGIDFIMNSQTLYSAIAFAGCGIFNVLATYFDGRKIRENAKVIQNAWYKISFQVFNKLLTLDLFD